MVTPSSRLQTRSLIQRAAPRALLCALAWCAVGCDAELQVAELALALRVPSGCELGQTERLELSALGDFPPERVRLDAAAPRADLRDFPWITRELLVEGLFAEQRASGRIDASSTRTGVEAEVWLIPEGRSCPLGDPAARASDGVAAAPLARGGLLLAGGTDEQGRGQTSALVLRSGRNLLELVPDAGLLLRRRYASATLVGEQIVIAGGAAGSTGPGQESYEVFDGARGVFAREASGRLGSPRLQHAALALADGRLLLAGGRADLEGDALASAELIALAGDPRPEPLALELARARIAPELLALDSGLVVLLGGYAASGPLVRTLERFERERFVAFDIELPDHARAVAAALPGDRIAWFGCGPAQDCALHLVLVRGESASVHELAIDFATAAPRGLLEPRMIAQEDGRLLITGRDPDAPISARAFVVDPSAASVVEVHASRSPSVLVPLADGVIVELDDGGGSIRRSGSLSAFAGPPRELVAAEALSLALDLEEHWERTDDALQATLDGARIDLPRLRFGDFELALRASGSFELVIAAADAPEVRLRFGGGAAPRPGCTERAADPDEPIRITRRAGMIEGAGTGCRVEWPATARARIALEAKAGARLLSLQVSR